MKRALAIFVAATVSSAAFAATDPRTVPTKLEPAWQAKTRELFKQAIEIPTVHNRGQMPKMAKDPGPRHVRRRGPLADDLARARRLGCS